MSRTESSPSTQRSEPTGVYRGWRSLAGVSLGAVVLAVAGCGRKEGTLWMPVQGSTYAPQVDWLFYYILWVSVFFTLLIVAAMVFFAVKFRQKERGEWAQGINHSTPLELTWTIIPTLIVLSFFVFGFKGMLDMYTPPEGESRRIYVTAKQWSWTFRHPDAGNAMSTNVLYLESNRPVELIMTSDDVIHSFWIPEFRGKKDVVPGRYTKIWFEPTWDESLAGEVIVRNIKGEVIATFEKGIEYQLKCTEYCGQDHSVMRATVVVLPHGEYTKAMEQIANPKATYSSPAAYGESLWLASCSSCHSVNGSPGTGPTWKGLWGRRETMSDGEVITVDENYIRESIANPNAKIVRGYAYGQMGSFASQFGEAEYIGIIDYIRQVSGEDVQENWPGSAAASAEPEQEEEE